MDGPIHKTAEGTLRVPEGCNVFFEDLVSDLNPRGFIINPYYPCVSNMMVNVNQMTTTCHFDDLNISQVDTD